MLPPGLLGFQMARQQQAQEQSQGLNQLQGLLGVQGAMRQQGLLEQQAAEKARQQANIDQFAATLSPDKRAMFMANPNAYFQEANKRHVVSGNLVDNSGRPIYEAPVENKIAPNGMVYNPRQLQPGMTFNDPNKAFGIGAGGVAVPNVPFQNFELDKASRGASKNVTNVQMPGDNKYIDTRRADQAKAFGELEKSAQSAYNQFSTLDRFIQASEKGFAGGAAPVLAGAANLLSSFGINVAPDKLKDTRIMEQAIGDILGNKMAELGARGLTDKDMEILRQNLPRVETDKVSRVAVANVLKKSAANTLREYENARNEEAKNFPELAGRSATPAWFKDYQRNTKRFGNAPVGPQPGTVKDGFRFKGGNPADKNNWEKVNG